MPIAAFNANDPYEQLIAQILSIERQPQIAIRTRQENQKVFKAVLTDFNSTLSALNASLDGLKDTISNPFTARAAKVPEGASFGVTASDRAATGSHSVQVERLAATDTRLSQRFDRDGTGLRSFFDASGAQTFTIEVASPTDEEPERRVGIDVTVEPEGATDAEILAEVRTAINDAMSAAAADGTIQSGDKAGASLVKETSDTSRLTLRSGDTGFANRLSFTDSEDGFLNLLQINRNASAATPATTTTTTTTPATAATVQGQTVSYPIVVDGSNEEIEIDVSGTKHKFKLTRQVYLSADDLAADMAARIDEEFGPGVLNVDVVDGALRLTTAATGAASSIQITDGDNPAAFGFEVMAAPATGTDEETTTTTTTTSAEQSGGQVTAVGTSETDSALNSVFQLDGLTLYRSGNEVTDALDGITLSLGAVGEAATFSVGPDSDSIVKDVEAFIKKYNDAHAFIKRKSNIDPDAGTRGDFVGDSSITSLRFGMRNDALRTVASQPAGAPARFADLGIEINDDGTLKLGDREKLLAAVEASPDAVQSFFGADDGVATRLSERIGTFLGTDGILNRRTKTIEDKIGRYDKQIARWEERLSMREESLRMQYAQLQESLALLQGQQDSLNSFFY